MVWPFVNPGDTLDIGDRVLLGHRPPLFANPATVGFLDQSTGAFFSSDCFGAPLSSSDLATGGDAAAITADERRSGQLLWATIDSPWVAYVDRAKYDPQVEAIRALDPSGIFSSHLPPAIGMNNLLLDALHEAPTRPRSSGLTRPRSSSCSPRSSQSDRHPVQQLVEPAVLEDRGLNLDG